MDNFQSMELKGRDRAIDLLKKKGFTHLCEAVDKYSEFDLIGFTSQGKPCIIEVKYRNLKIDTYKTVMLEKMKYDKLHKFEEKGFVPVYMCIYEDGYILFNLKYRPDLNITSISSPATTAGYQMKVDKPVYMLSVTRSDFKYVTSETEKSDYITK